MAEEMITFGDAQGLQIQLKWVRSKPGKSAVDSTKGSLLLWLGEFLVWGEFRDVGENVPVEWSWVELLEFLSNSWCYLEFETGYPIELKPTWPAELRSDAESRWQSMPDHLVRREEEELFAFEETHDLARGVHGLFLPSVWLIREGDLMSIGSRRTTIRRPLNEMLETLSRFGGAVSSRLASLSDDRSKAAVQGWDERRNLDPWDFVQIATRSCAEELHELIGTEDLKSAFDLPAHDLESTEPLALVGLARGYLGIKPLRELISLVKAEGKRKTPRIDSLSCEAAALLEQTKDRRPYNQGYVLANWIREQDGFVEAGGYVAIEKILRELQVRINDISLETDLLDAVACWGPKHGPAIWMNSDSKRFAFALEGARRATLAHELCHLLVDRSGALPLVDVVNGNVPKWVEQRADAFAAELLLPRKTAKEVAESIPDIENLVHTLTSRFGVSRELTAWQIKNSGIELSPVRRIQLRSMVSDPARF
ncbi:MAG: ImmA/IrrE family metallo-endopeptidase [Isosphaerales bacterium]